MHLCQILGYWIAPFGIDQHPNTGHQLLFIAFPSSTGAQVIAARNNKLQPMPINKQQGCRNGAMTSSLRSDSYFPAWTQEGDKSIPSGCFFEKRLSPMCLLRSQTYITHPNPMKTLGQPNVPKMRRSISQSVGTSILTKKQFWYHKMFKILKGNDEAQADNSRCNDKPVVISLDEHAACQCPNLLWISSSGRLRGGPIAAWGLAHCYHRPAGQEPMTIRDHRDRWLSMDQKVKQYHNGR